MEGTTKIGLIIAAFLVVIGLSLFVAVMSVYKWDFSKLGTNKYETNTYELDSAFSNISINTETAGITFALSNDETCRVECYEDEKVKHSVSVQENVLVINLIDNRAWYDHIGLNFASPKITVYLPETEYTSLSINESTGNIEIPKDFKFVDVDLSLSTGNVNFFASASKSVKIKASTGAIRVENASAGELDLSATTGKITVSNVTCEGDAKINVSTGKVNLNHIQCVNLTSNGSTGDIALNNIIAAGKLSIKRSTGNISFNGSDAAELSVKTTTGSVKGTLLSEKIFITETSTGHIDVPQCVTGGRCEIKTSTGNIHLDIQ